jgi:hypothetical protein
MRHHRPGKPGKTHPVLIYDPHILGDSLSIFRLCFYLSDLVQVQLRELKFLFALGDLGIKVDQALNSETHHDQKKYGK